MAVNTTVQVTLPAMGESVREGTILEWHKREGDAVAADETLVEVSTDKVDAEVPAPVAGTLLKVYAAEGETVAVGAVLAEIAPGEPAQATGDAEPGDGDDTGPAAIIDIVTPGGGESVTEGTILEWSVAPGDAVEDGQTIVEVSTDKVDMELPAPTAGTITEILAEPGETVAVGQVIARMQPGPAAPGANGAGVALPAAPPQVAPAPAPVSTPADGNGVPASPVARRVAAVEGIDISAVNGSGPAG
ncbi:MAG: hypothetical protein QOD69_1938, partial [Solirubrobacteraceae bacterium]|nr:hypothetical protein [Solirubrobacteraceae bacterium]